MRAISGCLILLACGPGTIYAPCRGPADCLVPNGAEPSCLDKSGEGFCTWACDTDADCLNPDEANLRVCASFESEEGSSCFPSCERDVGGDAACPPGFGCRSTGGGNQNKKVCFPQ